LFVFFATIKSIQETLQAPNDPVKSEKTHKDVTAKSRQSLIVIHLSGKIQSFRIIKKVWIPSSRG
jgi:hypothetical protein